MEARLRAVRRRGDPADVECMYGLERREEVGQTDFGTDSGAEDDNGLCLWVGPRSACEGVVFRYTVLWQVPSSLPTRLDRESRGGNAGCLQLR